MNMQQNLTMSDEDYIDFMQKTEYLGPCMEDSLEVLSVGVLQYIIELANTGYRSGAPYVTDYFYDYMIRELKSRDPENAFLDSVEPEEELIEGKTVKLPQRMLSTNKAYSVAEIEKWATDVDALAKSLGFQSSLFRITPKLDGFAAYYDGKKLYTRGNGISGTDISRVIERGMIMPSCGTGAGEIVVNKAYFKNYLSDIFDNTRNIIASVIKEGEHSEEISAAIGHGAITFQLFEYLFGYERTKSELIEDIEELWGWCGQCIYDTDGIVIEVVHDQDMLRQELGATNHHNKWQIAYKKNTEYMDVHVLSITPQTSKTGRITPVVELVPTKISGALISRATGHNYGNIIEKKIDTGAIVRVYRSGLVIPYIDSVIVPANEVSIPAMCPSCGSETAIDGDNLWCTNDIDCPAQVGGKLEFFFKTIGTVDGFGPKIIDRIVDAGITTIREIYHMDEHDFIAMGIGTKTANNLYDQLCRSLRIEIEDWRFLAAFSIPLVGKGGCEKLLKEYELEEVFDLWVEDITKIDGFAETTAISLMNHLREIRGEVEELMLFFTLTSTVKSIAGTQKDSKFLGKTIVFTGTFGSEDRKTLEGNAKSFGIKVGSAVTSKTDYLVCGEKVGVSKINAATKNGTIILTEDQYLAELYRR